MSISLDGVLESVMVYSFALGLSQGNAHYIAYIACGSINLIKKVDINKIKSYMWEIVTITNLAI